MLIQILGGIYTIWKNLRVVSKSYIILCNCGGRFELTLLFWFTILAKVNGLEKFKIVTGST